MDSNNIVEHYKKRFHQIVEMTIPRGIYEDDENQQQDPNGGGDQLPPIGQGDQDMGGSPMGGGAPMGGDPMGGGAPMGGPMDGGQQGPEGFDPQMGGDPMGGGAPMGGDPMMGGEQPQPEDDVVDITELVDSQEDTQDKIEGLDHKFMEIMKHIGAFEELIKSNNAKIEELEAEFEKRNPTQIEKLNLQTTKSYPFNVTPDDFWKEKEATSNYSTEPDNNGKGQGQYVITKDDVNGDVNWKSISDSLDDDDFIYNQTLKGAMGI